VNRRHQSCDPSLAGMRRIACETCLTRRGGALCDLPPDGLAEFRRAGLTSVYRPRQVVFSEGNPPLGIYLVCHGMVKLYHSERFGREHVLELARPGAVLGELVEDGAGEALSISAEAVEESQLCFLARDRIPALLERHPRLGWRLATALSRELGLARRKVRDLAFKGAESRLAGLLIEIAGEAGIGDADAPIPLLSSRRELAERIGVSTETAIRLLGRLARGGLIALERKAVRILDAEGLLTLARRGEA